MTYVVISLFFYVNYVRLELNKCEFICEIKGEKAIRAFAAIPSHSHPFPAIRIHSHPFGAIRIHSNARE